MVRFANGASRAVVSDTGIPACARYRRDANRPANDTAFPRSENESTIKTLDDRFDGEATLCHKRSCKPHCLEIAMTLRTLLAAARQPHVRATHANDGAQASG